MKSRFKNQSYQLLALTSLFLTLGYTNSVFANSCLPIVQANLPMTIADTGTTCYKLGGDLSYSAASPSVPGINVVSGTVAIDFNGHTMLGDGHSVMVQSTGANTDLTLTSGTIKNNLQATDPNSRGAAAEGGTLHVIGKGKGKKDFIIEGMLYGIVSHDGNLDINGVTVNGLANAQGAAGGILSFGKYNTKIADTVVTFPVYDAAVSFGVYADRLTDNYQCGQHDWSNLTVTATQPFSYHCAAVTATASNLKGIVNGDGGAGLEVGGRPAPNALAANLTINGLDITINPENAADGIAMFLPGNTMLQNVVIRGPSLSGLGYATALVHFYPGSPAGLTISEQLNLSLDGFVLQSDTPNAAAVIYEPGRYDFPPIFGPIQNPVANFTLSNGKIYTASNGFGIYADKYTANLNVSNVMLFSGKKLVKDDHGVDQEAQAANAYYGVFMQDNDMNHSILNNKVSKMCVGVAVGATTQGIQILNNQFVSDLVPIQITNINDVVYQNNQVVGTTPDGCGTAPAVPQTLYLLANP